MGLNYLLHRHQVALMMADAAASVEARLCHRQLARGYARRIETMTQVARGNATPLVPVA